MLSLFQPPWLELFPCMSRLNFQPNCCEFSFLFAPGYLAEWHHLKGDTLILMEYSFVKRGSRFGGKGPNFSPHGFGCTCLLIWVQRKCRQNELPRRFMPLASCSERGGDQRALPLNLKIASLGLLLFLLLLFSMGELLKGIPLLCPVSPPQSLPPSTHSVTPVHLNGKIFLS